MTKSEPVRRYRFGAFEADAATGELRRQGIRIKLNAQPFQVLLMLLEHPGVVLTREEISSALWPDGTFVDYDHGVNSAVNRIREALGDAANSPRFVETLARRGYRFVAAVEIIADQADGSVHPCRPGTAQSSQESELPGSATESSHLRKNFLKLRPPWCRLSSFCCSSCTWAFTSERLPISRRSRICYRRWRVRRSFFTLLSEPQ